MQASRVAESPNIAREKRRFICRILIRAIGCVGDAEMDKCWFGRSVHMDVFPSGSGYISQINVLKHMADLLPYSFMWTHACLEDMYAQRPNMHVARQAPSESRTTLHGCAARSMRVERERTTRGTISATSMSVVCLHAKATQHSPDAHLDRWGASGSEHPLARFHLNLCL